MAPTIATTITSTASSATSGRLLFGGGMSDLLLIFLFLLIGHLVQLFDLLLELLSAIVLEPLLLLLDETEAIVKVIIDDGSRDAEQSELLDNHEV